MRQRATIRLDVGTVYNIVKERFHALALCTSPYLEGFRDNSSKLRWVGIALHGVSLSGTSLLCAHHRTDAKTMFDRRVLFGVTSFTSRHALD